MTALDSELRWDLAEIDGESRYSDTSGIQTSGRPVAEKPPLRTRTVNKRHAGVWSSQLVVKALWADVSREGAQSRAHREPRVHWRPALRLLERPVATRSLL